MRIPELLSPAGNYTNFIAAVENGADAVYMGLPKFNARAMVDNFSVNDYIKAIKYAHIKNCKVYLTLNTLVRDDEIKDALSSLANLVSAGLDGVIIQDLGLADTVHKVFPSLPLHASTQMTVYNLEGVQVLESLGFKRVVLARELSLEEIRYIKEHTNVELEVFIHGAACVCYSGACFLSQINGGRSANRGSCAQPCRLRYELFDDTGERIAIGNLLSSKDIYGMPYLKELSKMGIDCLKIEGRAKTPEYVSVVTSKYRKYLDLIKKDLDVEVTNEDENELLQVFNRGGKHSHYFEGKKGKDSISYQCSKNWGLPLGTILDVKDNMVKVKLFSSLDMHDGVEILDGSLSGVVTCIRDDRNILLNSHVKEDKTVWIGDFKENSAKPGDIIYKTTSSAITAKYKDVYEGRTILRKNYLSAVVTIKEGYPLSLEVYNDDYKIKLNGTVAATKASKKPVMAYDVEEKLQKTKSSAFVFTNIIYDIDPNIFIPISEVNKLKQLALEKMEAFYEDAVDVTDEKIRIKALNDEHNSVINMKGIEKTSDILIYNYDEKVDYAEKNPERIYIDSLLAIKNPGILNKLSYIGNIYISLPTVCKGKMGELIKENIPNWAKQVKGFLIPNLCYFKMLENYKELKLIGDSQLNVYNNYTIRVLKRLGLYGYTLSTEIDEQDAKKLDLRDAVVVASGPQVAMTTEYCPVGAFAGGFTATSPCRKPCAISNNYYLVDQNGNEMKVQCNPITCSSRLFKDYTCSFDVNKINPHRIRYDYY